jgi:hypothetical protein
VGGTTGKQLGSCRRIHRTQASSLIIRAALLWSVCADIVTRLPNRSGWVFSAHVGLYLGTLRLKVLTIQERLMGAETWVRVPKSAFGCFRSPSMLMFSISYDL